VLAVEVPFLEVNKTVLLQKVYFSHKSITMFLSLMGLARARPHFKNGDKD
jgi:hypothetical protein